jgi:hypothetical protein
LEVSFQDLLSALALMLVFEGILPFLTPDGHRKVMTQMAGMNDRTLRITGFISMVAGLGLLLLIR